MILLTAGTLTDPQLPARASNVCKTGWHRSGGIGRVASTGWHRPGGIGRVASGGWHRPGGIGRVPPPQILGYAGAFLQTPHEVSLFPTSTFPHVHRPPTISFSSSFPFPPSIFCNFLFIQFTLFFVSHFCSLFLLLFPIPSYSLIPPSRYPCPRCILHPLPFSSFCAMLLCLTIIIHG